jgi:hypothetical protein
VATVFRDAKGRSWEVVINVCTARRVKDLVGLDLFSRASPSPFDAMAADPVLLVNVLWAIVSKQAEARGVADEDFGAALVGDPISHATDALLQEFARFFPTGQRLLLERALADAKAMEQDAVSRFSKFATSSPASRASIPVRKPWRRCAAWLWRALVFRGGRRPA